jgi:hypothetical protein
MVEIRQQAQVCQTQNGVMRGGKRVEPGLHLCPE